MEPVTHAVASLALGRAGLGRVTRLAAPMLLISGVAADADWIGYVAGAPTFLQWHRTASHSLLAAAAISATVAAGFWLWSQRRSEASRRVAYWRALAVCVCGAGMHLLLDLTNDAGVKLLWPFHHRWFAWDLAREVDPALLVILLAGLLLPALLNLVSEEIGVRRGKRPGRRGAIVALALAAAYLGVRAAEHQRALVLLDSHVYQQETPTQAGAFPTVSPLLWRGVVETETAMHEMDVSLMPGAEFDARDARSQFKPENSQALQSSAATETAREFLEFARFPMARLQPALDGFEVRIRDLRQSATAPGATEIVAVIELNARQEVTRSNLEFALARR